MNAPFIMNEDRMHSVDVDNYTFHFNSDMSGDVIVHYTSDKGKETFEIPGSVILRFLAEFLRRERITQVENMSDDEILYGQ